MNPKTIVVGVVLAICGTCLGSGPARAGESCRGKLSGALSGEFTCSVDATYREKKDKTALVISVAKPPAGVSAIAPCSFDIKGKPAVGTYTLKDLGTGAAVVNGADNATYTASAGARLGALTLQIDKAAPEGKRGFALTGKVTATLQEIGGQRTVQVEVTF